MVRRFVYLVRHGGYGSEGNHDKKLGFGLTPIGVRQARATAKRFSNMPVTAIHASSLLRAVETAAVIAEKIPHVPFHTTSVLWEGIPCVPRGLEKDSDRWPMRQVRRQRKRADKAFARYFKPARGVDKHDVIVGHGNVIRYLICRVLDVDPVAWASFDICNCGVTEVFIRSDGARFLVSHNDVSHLPSELRTYVSDI